jgi:hypothetical protein
MITLNKISIPVSESFSVKLEWVNPFCYFDKIYSDAGLGIEIDVNEITRAIFGNPERFEKYSEANNRKFSGFEIRKKGELLGSGSLEITDANSETYSAWLQPEVGVMGEELQDKFINELAWKKDVVFENKASYDYTTDDYCIARIKNPRFWEGKGASGNVIIPFVDEDGEEQIREEFKNYLQDQFDDGYDDEINIPIDQFPPGYEDNRARVASPYLFFRYFLKEILRVNQFYIRSHPFDAIPGANALIVYNNYNIFSPDPETLEREFFIFDKKLNEYRTVTREAVVSTTWSILPFTYADLVPKVSIDDAILGIQNWMNVCFWFRPDRTVEIIDRETVFDTEAFDLTQYQVSEWRKKTRKKVTLKFVAEYDKEDANFGDEFHDLSDRLKDFKEPVDNYEDLFWITDDFNPIMDRTLGQLRYVRSENKIYEFKWHSFSQPDANGTEEEFNILDWVFVSSGPQPYYYHNGEEEEEIKTCISTLQMEDGFPEVKQHGNVHAMRNLWTDFTFRMFYYNGNNDGSVTHSGSGRTCNWEGPQGIFNKRWKKTARWWANRQPLEAEFNMPLNVLRYVKNNMVKQKFRTEKGSFIIEKITVDAGVDEMGLVTLKVYKA